ncbi:UNVERIFIED_CONTAM: hypothetical protein Scaly_1601400 [Sesamum calycinum]|uniref:Uncharacterized protein n=1 Tax=Sesamum calycinum TaxID=2727403 RepID=A0AAW2P761_9LAMI
MEENKEESLCEAARNGDLGRVESLIASGADVTYFDGEGLTPLMHAARNGCAEVVKMLLDSGAPWNAVSPSNLSAGDFAMENGHQSAFDILLNAGWKQFRDNHFVLEQAYKLNSWNNSKERQCKGNPNGDYLEDRVTFSEDKVMDTESKAVMMAWERPLMEAHAKAICSGGGHILNVGLAWVSWILQYNNTHLCHILLSKLTLRSMIVCFALGGVKRNVKIVFGRWQDVLSQLESYDGKIHTYNSNSMLFGDILVTTNIISEYVAWPSLNLIVLLYRA